MSDNLENRPQFLDESTVLVRITQPTVLGLPDGTADVRRAVTHG